MAKFVTKLKLHNFRRFPNFAVDFDSTRNLLIGDNEAGKSSILQAIEIVIGGSRSRVETLGLESLIHAEAVADFMSGDRSIDSLPKMWIEVYLSEQGNPDLNGRNNSENIPCDGLKLVCTPMDEFAGEVSALLQDKESSFPFEYYGIRFLTFANEAYTGYRRYLRHLMLDSSQINNEYATREYVKRVYRSQSEDSERNRHHNEYRKHKSVFGDVVLREMNESLDKYRFSVATTSKANLETDLTITEDDISIENKGKGRQCFIKTEFALGGSRSANPLDLLLLEEPENHLSHQNMKKLVSTIAEAEGQQLMVTTHNSVIATRLDLRNAILLNSSGSEALRLNDLPPDTAAFFIKAADNNVLEFVLSKRVILVEGDAEFILLDAFYKAAIGTRLKETDIHVISVGGTSFKRYLDIAKLLNIKTAVIRDNDGDNDVNCVSNYSDYTGEAIRIFSETDNNLWTFEVSVYEKNKELCDGLFSEGRVTLSPQEYMLKNKADAAFKLLQAGAADVGVPKYIDDAFQWISA